ncbi:hypothetical protein BJ138DRAFT_1114912 [Hygrophoropsis aurantiaca]|uniref:Uncharacterized protein n=1 Tax=Hygrophoropsis aurantiaca TaxID=72124 RepID=A0ACB8A8G3_9AGAM|nr:hypothetical protein BJ138DRAFT_1114912 [Hygrophoropsis aurantiaca]
MVGARKHPNADPKHNGSSPDTEDTITHKKQRTMPPDGTNAPPEAIESLMTSEKNTTTPMTKSPVEIMRSLKKILQVPIYEVRDGTNIQLVDFTIALAPESEITHRILNITTSPDAGSIYNIALASPSNFSRTTGGIISHKTHPSEPATFFTTGIVQWSSTTTGLWNRQICITPSNLTWPRASSFMGQIFHEKALSFNTWNRGISFSTKNKSKGTSASPTHVQRGLVNAGVSSSQPSALSGNPLQWYESIPTYDGRKAFALTQFNKLPKIDHEIEVGSAVLVIFSASTYDARGNSQPKHVNKTVSVNAVSIVLLADPITTENDAGPSTPPNYTSGDLGVESDHTLSSDDEQAKHSTSGPIILL